MRSREETTGAALDDEELDLELKNTQGRKDQPESKRVTKSAFSNEKARIIKFFERYGQYLEKEVDKLIQKSNKDDYEEEEKVSITELSNFVIALYIAIYYTDNDRQYTVGEETHHEKIIKSYGFQYYDNLAIINTDIVGRFLLLCTRGFKNYNSEYLNERLEKLKIEAFYHCLFCFSQAKWSVSNMFHRDLLLLNSIHYLLDQNEYLSIKENIFKEANTRIKFSASQTSTLLVDIISLIDKFLPRYLVFTENMQLCVDKRKKILSKDLIKDDIIFTSHLGFCTVYNKQLQNGAAVLILSRPGFEWDEKEEDYLLKEKRGYKANILFY